MNNFFIIILDGVGVGELPDAGNYGDEGSNTIANIAKHIGEFNLPNLQSLGLGNIIEISGLTPSVKPLASYGKMQELSKGKDSTTGHWEIAGLKLDFDFPYYPNGFPVDVVENFKQAANVSGILGNKPASGTAIIDELGAEHVKTGYPIVYTSADSVFQIAAHEDVIPVERLYEICQIARDKVLVGQHAVGRVIARPFIGEPGNFNRTTNRKDFSLNPPSDTIINFLQQNNIQTIAIGKINDLFNYNGIDVNEKAKSNSEGMSKLIHYTTAVKNSFVFINLVDFDVYFGHRNDTVGFYNALREFDDWLPSFLENLDETDALIITADHGNDPTTPSTDHSREYVPLLFYRKNKAGRNLGNRKTFSDAAQTVAHFYKINNNLSGSSFLNE